MIPEDPEKVQKTLNFFYGLSEYSVFSVET